MAAPTPPFERFLAALHRRLVAVRAAESAALGGLAGCAVAGALIPLLMWRDQPALPPTLGLMATGVLGGLAWAVLRCPSRLDAAAEADRQLDLADLLATAHAIRPRPRDSDRDAAAAPWLDTVVALADAAARRHSPSDVILRRLHARAWGGIALAAALVLTLAGLAANPPILRASRDNSATNVRQNRPRPTAQAQPGQHPASRPNPATRQVGAHSPTASPDRTITPSTEAAPRDTAPETTTPSATPNATNTSSNDQGPGGGAARARDPKPPVPPPAARTPTTSRSPDPTAHETGAGGSANTPSRASTPDASDVPTGATAGTQSPAPSTPPWHSPSWAADVERARQALNSNDVPDAHRDLVREYFDRP